MPVPANKYGPENRVANDGQLTVMDQMALGQVGSTKTASATAGAATLNSPSGIVTSESLTTAAAGAATYTLTITNSTVAATDIVQVNMGFGTNTAGSPTMVSAVAGAGQIVIKVMNTHPSAALNGTLTFAFVIVKV